MKPIDSLTETTLSSAALFNGTFLKAKVDTARLPDGSTGIREYIAHPGAVMIVPVLPDGQLLLERQYRYPLRQVFIEFPAGKIDPNEDPLDTAKRELFEETGYTATHWQHFHTHHPVISYSTERIEFYLATGLVPGARKLDEGEFLELFTASADALIEWVKEGKVTDGKTTSGVLLARALGLV